MNGNIIIYFYSYGVEHVPREIKKILGNKDMITNIYRTEAYDLMMCGYFCIMLKDKSLLDNTNLFSPNDYEKNDKIILKYFQ